MNINLDCDINLIINETINQNNIKDFILSLKNEDLITKFLFEGNIKYLESQNVDKIKEKIDIITQKIFNPKFFKNETLKKNILSLCIFPVETFNYCIKIYPLSENAHLKCDILCMICFVGNFKLFIEFYQKYKRKYNTNYIYALLGTPGYSFFAPIHYALPFDNIMNFIFEEIKGTKEISEDNLWFTCVCYYMLRYCLLNDTISGLKFLSFKSSDLFKICPFCSCRETNYKENDNSLYCLLTKFYSSQYNGKRILQGIKSKTAINKEIKRRFKKINKEIIIPHTCNLIVILNT